MKTEGNRCTRNCFQCPSCFAAVTVTASVEAAAPGATTSTLSPSGETVAHPSGPYSLTCHYCHWSSREIGLEFEKPSNLTTQLAKQLKAASGEKRKPKFAEFSTNDTLFGKLKSHYSSQGIGVQGSGLGVGRGDEYGTSPGTLSRLMGLYTGGIGGIGGKRNISGFGSRGRDVAGKKIELTEMEDVDVVADEMDMLDKLFNSEYDDSMAWLDISLWVHGWGLIDLG